MEAELGNAPAQTLPAARSAVWRHFLIRDGLTVLSLTLVAVVLGGVTTVLFRSFQAHREALAVVWAERGGAALQHHQPEQAVVALRTSLAYRPDNRETQLALAGALAASGHTNEAENYFLTLWQAQPGDGLINLHLARLERSRGDASAAVNYYRAAVFGTWQGDAPMRRRDIRLELSQYLVERGQLQAARSELLIAAGNNADGPTQLAIGETLEQAHDAKDAMIAYRNVMESGPDAEVAQAKAGELCYRMGDYACASDALTTALRSKRWLPGQITRMTVMQQNAERLQQLSFGPDQPPLERASHLLKDARIAQSRLKLCMDSGANASSAPLQQMRTRWKDLDSSRNRNALRHDNEVQARYADAIEATETVTTSICGAPSGDDALLAYFQDHPATQIGAAKQ